MSTEPTLKRRTLLKLLTASSLAPAALPGRAGAFPARREPGLRRSGRLGAEAVEELPSICDLCFWRCGILVQVRDGRIVRVRGNPDHPRSKGRLCARGNAGRHMVDHPDRLSAPLLRVGERGEGKWKRISWDQALDLWAEKTRQAIAEHGPGSIGLFSHGLASRFMNAFMLHLGNPNRAAPSFGQCRGPRDVGFQLTFGDGPGSPERHDMARSRMIVLLGCHIGENVQTGQVAEFAEALSRGARLVVADPRMSVAASKADRWLPIRPGTDTALLLAWIHVLLAEESYDRDYIQRHSIGIDSIRRAVRPCTPAWASEVTQLPREAIVEEARWMARHRPAVLIHCGRFSAWYGNDTQRARAMAILTALLGAWGRPGGYFLRSRIPLGPRACPPPHGEMDESAASGRHAFTHFGVAAQEIVEASIGPRARIKQWVFYADNLAQSHPDFRRIKEAMRRVDFITMVDIWPTEGALWADLILPEASYLERHGDVYAVEDHPRPFVALRQPAIPPRCEAKEPYWIAQQLAHRLGHTDCFTQPDVTGYLDARLAPLGIGYEELARKGIHQLDEQQPFLPECSAHRFATPSGKIELFSSTLESKGHDPIPRFEAVEQPEPGWYRLLSGRSPYHTGARTQNLSRLARQAPQNSLWINADEARAKGLRSGDLVYLENQDGFRTGPIAILATAAIRSDAVFMVHGFGSRSPAMRFAHAKGISDNLLSSRYAADGPTGGTGFRVNFVQLVDREGKEIGGTSERSLREREAYPKASDLAPAPDLPDPSAAKPRADEAGEKKPLDGKKPQKKAEDSPGVFQVKPEDSC
ncbi:MAG: molybdopterin-dependent oxidoreductase [Deltaproteobacteria bacterium]|nr:molybdopterin-dependent oxidoreductase [Deltaproteobacteria bacterium]